VEGSLSCFRTCTWESREVGDGVSVRLDTKLDGDKTVNDVEVKNILTLEIERYSVYGDVRRCFWTAPSARHSFSRLRMS
jgi:hypothetical protein